ncbi:MAG: DNA repair protein RecN [Faecalibacterium sp.]|nr:DNA repair protein RecN [Ruminococcus sp.]MCM1485188.1 DNA repair protein RecN [Faecalibacterium sp.]
MLTNLKIENVAVIESANITFDDELNILTGETGAGKSIVIDSINAILGERTSKELVRDGASNAKVTAFFEDISDTVKASLEELEIDCEDDNSLLITRTITADGRSSCRVNGQPITVSMLKKIGVDLITICGQHDSQKLLQKESHITYIDTLAGIDFLKDEYRMQYRKLIKLKRELLSIKQDESDKVQRLEFLKYQIDELQNANITIGERDELLAEKKKIQNREKIISSLYNAHRILNGDENTAGLMDSLYNLSSFLAQLSDYHAQFETYEKSIDNFRYEMEDCVSALSSEISSMDDNDIDIDSIEERLDLLYRLSRKYGSSEEEMLDYLEKITNEYDSIITSDERVLELESEIDKLSVDVLEKAKAISDKRKAFATQFEIDVMAELEYLDMRGARFKVLFNETSPQENGIDEIEFLISANSGQEPKTLSKIASGGELSRVMLAIRCVISGSENIGTMIFDEIDTGVSGRAAHKIAYKLKQISNGRQVICVTHLAQIAAAANNHLFIEKNTVDSKTYTVVKKLDGEQRISEIARIIGGDVITDATLMSARELIDFADKS